MIALEISINGKKVLTAGVEDWDLLHANIIAKRAREQQEHDEFDINVGGLPQQVEQEKLEHIRWGRKKLQIGDEITIRLIDTDSVDAPLKRYRSDKKVQEQPFTDEEIYQMQKETYLELKKKFENEERG